MILLQQMIILFLIMMVGFVSRRTGILNKDASKLLSGIVVNVANPALILSSSINPEAIIEGRELAITVGLAIGLYMIYLLLAEIIPRIMRVRAEEFDVYKVMTVFSNIGFMGFPLLAAMYGSESLLYASLFTIPYNILIYTYGAHTLTKSERVSEEKKGIQWRSIFNIGVITSILALLLYFFRFRLPVVLESAVDT